MPTTLSENLKNSGRMILRLAVAAEISGSSRAALPALSAEPTQAIAATLAALALPESAQGSSAAAL